LLTAPKTHFTPLAGFIGMTWPTTSQSKSMRMPASCNLTEGGDPLQQLLDVRGYVNGLHLAQMNDMGC
jgi:hypothetical protein